MYIGCTGVSWMVLTVTGNLSKFISKTKIQLRTNLLHTISTQEAPWCSSWIQRLVASAMFGIKQTLKLFIELTINWRLLIFNLHVQHNIKKIRNNVQKSNVQGKPRCLKLGGKAVTWQQFRQAFNWDQECFSLPLHERLTPQHFELDSAAKMRNHLAEDVLDCKMLFLMQVCS